MAAKKYRMLKAGEVVLPTDQVYVGDPINKWLYGSLNCGRELPAKYVGKYRRQEAKEAGRTVKASTPVQQPKAKIGCPKCGRSIWLTVIHKKETCPTCKHVWQPKSAVW